LLENRILPLFRRGVSEFIAACISAVVMARRSASS
jgi:hypothetical protein